MNTKITCRIFAGNLLLGGVLFASSAAFALPVLTAGRAPISMTAIGQAVATNTVAEHLKSALGFEPSEDQLAAFEKEIFDLIEANPSAAANAGSAMVEVAWDKAADYPKAAILELDIARRVLCHPAVVAVEPEIAAQALAELHGAARLADRSAATKGIEIDTEEMTSQENRCMVLDEDLIAEMIALADAQADLDGFVTAAGQPVVPDFLRPTDPVFAEFPTPPTGGFIPIASPAL